MPAPAPRPCNRLLPTLQIQAQKASDSLRHRRRGRGADLRTGSWPQGRSASPPELARLPDAEDTRGGACPARLRSSRRIVETEIRLHHESTSPIEAVPAPETHRRNRQRRAAKGPPLRHGGDVVRNWGLRRASRSRRNGEIDRGGGGPGAPPPTGGGGVAGGRWR